MEHKKSNSLFGPLLLIGVGILFLLNNLGIIDWNVWESLWRFWPIFLIAAGLDIVFGRKSGIGALLIIGVVVVLIIGSNWSFLPGYSARGNETTETISHMLNDAAEADVKLEVGAGTLDLRPLAEIDRLIEGTVELGPGLKLDQSYRMSNGKAHFSAKTRGKIRWKFGKRNKMHETWTVRLNRNVPTDLTVSTGVGKTTLDLDRMNLTNLDLDIGVGEVRVTLPRRGKLDATISGGVGPLVVRIPAGMAARISVDTGIGTINVKGDYVRQGDEWISPTYESATNRIDLSVDGGVGNITIEAGGGE